MDRTFARLKMWNESYVQDGQVLANAMQYMNVVNKSRRPPNNDESKKVIEVIPPGGMHCYEIFSF